MVCEATSVHQESDVALTARQFEKRLRDLRKKTGKSQGELAEKAGLSLTYLNQLEAGKRDPSLSPLTRLARALGETVEALVSAERGHA